MADRYTTLTYSTAVSAGQTKQCALTLPNNIVNIAKLRMTQSDNTITSKFAIYKLGTYAAAKKVYATKEYTGTLVDPVEDDGVLISERNQRFVCAYEDEGETLTLWFTIENTGASSCTYSLTVVVDTVYSHTGAGLVTGVPEGLTARAYASYLKITSGVVAKKNTATIDYGEFRAIFVPSSELEKPYYDLRTVEEGGTFAADGTTKLIINSIEASQDGAQYIFDSANPGTWYYAWKLHNSVGWSLWTDGNTTPRYVTQFVRTRNDTADTGPPEDWDIVIERGPVSNSVVVTTTRPRVNGDVINWYIVQIKEGNTGTWTSLFNGPDADNIRYDGSAVNHTLSSRGNRLTKIDGLGWGTAAPGDLVLLDVRGGTWDEAYCQWATVYYVADNNNLYINGFFRPQAYADMRVVIVKPPWAWTSGGYLGGYAGHGFWPQVKEDENTFIGDTATQNFRTTAIVIPSGVSQPEARVWFENDYSRNDDGENHTTGMVGLPTQFTWTKFNDTRWWIPKYDQTGYATLDFNATGAAVIEAITPRYVSPSYSTYGNIFGVQGHFRLFPDTNGLMMFRCKFENVYIPEYTDTDTVTERTNIAILLKTGNTYWYTDMVGLFWGNFRNEATIRWGLGRLSTPNYSISSFDYSYIAVSPTQQGYLQVARPTPPYTLEMRLGFSTGTGATHNDELSVTTMEYRLGGAGAWTAMPSVATGMWNALPTEDYFLYGIQPTIGMMESQHTPGKLIPDYTCKLTEVAVEYGIIRQMRLV